MRIYVHVITKNSGHLLLNIDLINYYECTFSIYADHQEIGTFEYAKCVKVEWGYNPEDLSFGMERLGDSDRNEMIDDLHLTQTLVSIIEIINTKIKENE